MDDVVTGLISLLFVLSPIHKANADVEYISPAKTQELQSQFDQAKTPSPKDLSNHTYKCDMYGARSHMQVKHGLSLYKWQVTQSGLHNEGAQPVSEYKTAGTALVGTKGKFEDQVKVTPKGELISKLCTTTPEKLTVAFAVCTAE